MRSFDQLRTLALVPSRAQQKSLIIDVLILSGFYALVPFAHLLPIPIYRLDPMKLVLIIAVLYSSRGNALFMAAAIPLLSMLSSGHPVFPKTLVIGVELMVFSAVLMTDSFKQYGCGLHFVIAMVSSKSVYYLLKASLVAAGWIPMPLFATSIQTQAEGTLLVFILYWLLSSKKS